MKKCLFVAITAITCSLISAHAADINQQLKLNWGLSARQGKRPTMEDTHVASAWMGDTFFGLYDGHGGPEAARIAAHSGYNQTDSFANNPLHMQILCWYTKQKILTSLINNYHIAYKNIDNHIKNSVDRSGTTALTAHITQISPNKPTLIMSWAGDSRAVLIDNNGSAVIATKDHKPADPDEYTRIINEGGTVTQFLFDCPRVGGRLAVSRALGDKDIKEQVKGISAEPSFITCQLELNHQALIMACDGVWDVISNEEAAQIVNKTLHEQKVLEQGVITKEQCIEDGNNVRAALAARTLRDAAYNKGSTDNISVMIVIFNT